MPSHLLSSIKPYKKTPILVYHKIDNIPKTDDTFGLSVFPGSFEKQMEHISRSKKCLSLEDYANALTNGKSVPDNSVVITFDDGYKDNYTNGFPILKKHNLMATFFIVTNLVGITNKWDELRGEIRSNLLSWDEISMMSRAGMSFGSHSATHPRLTACSDEQFEQEFRGSKRMLEERLNKRIGLFSYPWGDSNLRTTQVVKTAGYIAACSDRKAQTEELLLYNLNRIHIDSSDSPTLFKIKVSGWYDWIENLLTIVKIRGATRRLKTFKYRTEKLFYATDQTEYGNPYRRD